MKNTNTYTYILLIFFLSLTLFSCRKPCIHVKGLNSSSMAITFFNSRDNEYFYLLHEQLSPFKRDSLKVSSSDGFTLRHVFGLNQSPANPLKTFYVAGIAPTFDTQSDKDAFDREKTKYLYIQYNHNTFDTLQLVFKAKKTDCADEYEYLKVYHRNKLIASVTNDYQIEFMLNH